MNKTIFFLILIFGIFHMTLNGNEMDNEEQEQFYSAKIVKINNVFKADKDEADMLKKKVSYMLLIQSGEKKGEFITITQPYFHETKMNLNLYKGATVIVSEQDEEQYIIAFDNSKKIISLLLLFGGVIICLTKVRGIKAIFGLVLSVSIIIYIFIPLIRKGISPLLLAMIFLMLATVISLMFISGINKKLFSSSIGIFSGMLFSGIISIFYIKFMHLSGYYDMEIFNASEMLQNIDILQLLSAGIIIGSLGAVMDVAVSISASLSEIKEHKPEINESQLFYSGLNIGKDIIGTMINTLVFAYLGTSLVTIILFQIQSGSYPLIRIINFEFVIVEILRAVCGSIGILVTVPATAYAASKIYSKSGG